MIRMPEREGSVHAVRIRKDWVGRAVLTVCFDIEHIGWPGPNGEPARWTSSGRISEFRNVRMGDPAEVAAVMEFINGVR